MNDGFTSMPSSRNLTAVLQRQTSKDGVVYYVSPLLHSAGVRHAFSTRQGGESPAPFDSLNLGNPNGQSEQDDYGRIWRNYARLLRAIDCPGDPPLRVHQVHGNVVAQALAGQPFNTDCQADAIVSDDSARPVSVRVADCLPILLATDDGRWVAAVHAGWRGIVAGVLEQTIRQLREKHPDVALLAAMGPCIGPGSFEVGPEVVAEFRRIFEHDERIIQPLPDGKARIDLRLAARRQLNSCGLRNWEIDSTDCCTVSQPDEFFSHRRDRGLTGRMAAAIAANPS